MYVRFSVSADLRYHDRTFPDIRNHNIDHILSNRCSSRNFIYVCVTLVSNVSVHRECRKSIRAFGVSADPCDHDRFRIYVPIILIASCQIAVRQEIYVCVTLFSKVTMHRECRKVHGRLVSADPRDHNRVFRHT